MQVLKAFNDCFRCVPEEINYVNFEVRHRGADTVRTTRVVRAGTVQRESDETPIQRA